MNEKKPIWCRQEEKEKGLHCVKWDKTELQIEEDCVLSSPSLDACPHHQSNFVSKDLLFLIDSIITEEQKLYLGVQLQHKQNIKEATEDLKSLMKQIGSQVNKFLKTL